MNNTQKLLKGLKIKEINEFLNVIEKKSEKSYRLLQYLLELNRKGKNYDKLESIKKVYGTGSKPEKEEANIKVLLSSLNNEIVDFMVELQFRKGVNENKHLSNLFELKAYFDRGLLDQFKSKYEKYHEEAKQELQPALVQEMEIAQLRYLVENKEVRKSNLRPVIDFLEEHLKTIKQRFTRDVRNIQKIKAYIEVIMMYNRQEVEFSKIENEIKVNLPGNSDLYSEYLYYCARSFQQKGKEKINSLKSAIHLLDQCQFPGMDSKRNKVTYLGNIALEYFLLQRYEEAEENYDKIFKLVPSYEMPVDIRLVLNRLSNFIHWERYDEALKFYERYKGEISNEKIWYHHFEVMRRICLLFLKRPQQAVDGIERIKMRGLMPSSRFYYHYIRILSAYQLEDFEKLEKECRNLSNALDKTDDQDFDINYHSISSPFFELLKVLAELPEKRQPTKKAINMQVNALRKSDDSTVRIYLPLKLLSELTQ